MTARLQAAVDSLIADPRAFLETRYLVISGGAMPGPQTYWIQEIVENSQVRHVRFEDQAKFQIGSQAILQGPKLGLPVIGIPMLMQNQVDIGALVGVPLPTGPARIAVTGQLSGCSYFVARTAAGVLATHIKPSTDGAQLNTQMARSARFSNPGANFPYLKAAVFGRQFYHVHATVVGVYRQGAWEFWAQMNNGMSKEILGARQIL